MIETISPRSPDWLFAQIAWIYESELSIGLLPKLGNFFLKRFFRAAARYGILIVHVEHKAFVNGFVLGSANSKLFYARMLLRLWPYILAAVLRSPQIRHRAKATGSYIAKSDVSLPKAELLSIAVSQSNQRRGIGAELVSALERRFAALDVCKYRVTTAKEQTGAIAFYRKRGGLVVSETNVGGLPAVTFVMTGWHG